MRIIRNWECGWVEFLYPFPAVKDKCVDAPALLIQRVGWWCLGFDLFDKRMSGLMKQPQKEHVVRHTKKLTIQLR